MSSWTTDLRYRMPGRYMASWGALVLLLMVVAVVSPTTFSGASIQAVSAVAGALALASLGQMLVVVLGAIDLSVPAIMAASAAIVVHFAGQASATTLVLAALGVAMSLSLVNGIFIMVFRLNPIVVTLGTFGVISGAIALWTGVSFSVSGKVPSGLQSFATFTALNVNACFWVAIVAGICLYMALTRTRPGRQVSAIGANRTAAKLQGIPVIRIELVAFAVVGLLYGGAGVLAAGYVGSPDSSIGSPFQLATITAVAIAGAAFSGGPASVSSVLGACLFLQFLSQALAINGFTGGQQVIAQGVALVVAVAAITLAQYAVSAVRWMRRTSRSQISVTTVNEEGARA